MGHEVHIAYMHGGMNLLRVQQDGVRLHRLAGKSHYDPKILISLFSLIKRLRPDLVQTWNPMMDILGGGAARVNQTPWVIREPNNWRQYPTSVKSRLRILLGLRAEAIISNSGGGDDYWASLGFKGPRYIIPNALPVEEIDQLEKSINFNGLNIKEKHKLIFFAGRLENKAKNIKNLFYAILPIVRQQPVIAIFCGDGPYKVELERLIKVHEAADQIFLPGIVDPIWPVIKAADLFVSVSYHEGCPNMVLEAIACGCPLVVSDIPAHREILDDKSALLVSPNEPADITKAIDRVLKNPEEAEFRCKEAKNLVAGKSINLMAQKYCEVYRQILNH
jgi:glycosyltransferase involved in cell wall biosynthesis